MTLLLIPPRKSRKAALHRIFEAFAARIDDSKGVLLKPNIVFPAKPNGGEITPPAFVKDVIEVLRERNPHVDIIIGEGVAAGCDPQRNFEISGYRRLAHDLEVPLIDLHGSKRQGVKWTYGTLEIPSAALDRAYINLPILKPSSACLISGAMKNQKGLLLPAVKKDFHLRGLHDQIARLNAVVKPDLTIMDGHIFWGRPVIIAGDNCGEIDAAVCRLLGIDEPEHVRRAVDLRIFEEGDKLEGDDPVLLPKARRPVVKEYKRMGRLRLWSNPRACTMCRYAFRDLRRIPTSRGSLMVTIKLLRHAFSGADIIIGSKPRYDAGRRPLICFGDCTRSIARDDGHIFIAGCPPRQEDLAKGLSKKVRRPKDRI